MIKGTPIMWLRNDRLIKTGDYHTIKLMRYENGYSIVGISNHEAKCIKRFNNLEDALEDYGYIWDCLEAGMTVNEILEGCYVD